MPDKEQSDEQVNVMIGVPIRMLEVMEKINEVALLAVMGGIADLTATAPDSPLLNKESMGEVMEKVRIMLKLKSTLREMISQGEKASAEVQGDIAIAKAAAKDKP